MNHRMEWDYSWPWFLSMHKVSSKLKHHWIVKILVWDRWICGTNAKIYFLYSSLCLTGPMWFQRTAFHSPSKWCIVGEPERHLGGLSGNTREDGRNSEFLNKTHPGCDYCIKTALENSSHVFGCKLEEIMYVTAGIPLVPILSGSGTYKQWVALPCYFLPMAYPDLRPTYIILGTVSPLRPLPSPLRRKQNQSQLQWARDQ